MNEKVLIIEDEPSISDNIEYALKTEGFIPLCATTGSDGLNILDSPDIKLIILDIGLPDIDGFELCRKIRRISDIPIIFLTARNAEIDRIVGLEIGGDDYITKPFSPRELTARIRAILRRVEKKIPINKHKSKNNSNFTIDNDKKEILYCGIAVRLSRYEYAILSLLIAHPGKKFSRSEIMHTIWESPEASMERTVDTHIKTIRSKLVAIKPDSMPIATERGFGYYLDHV